MSTAENMAVGLQLLIQLTEAAQRMSLLLKNAQNEGRDINKDELEALRKEDEIARKTLQDLIDANTESPDKSQFRQPPLDQLMVDPLRKVTAAEDLDQSVADGISTKEDAEKAKEDSKLANKQSKE